MAWATGEKGGAIVRISILQPRIRRGDIEYNARAIQRMLPGCRGDYIILAEYALTGSLVLDDKADAKRWAEGGARAVKMLEIPPGKQLILNSLRELEDGIYNACTLLPSGRVLQKKAYPDQPELDAGVRAGDGVPVQELGDKKVVVVICSDLREANRISTEGADFVLHIFHFTPENYEKVMGEAVRLSKERAVPVLISSLVSDRNCGRSCYINGSVTISLSHDEGILEIDL